MSTDNGKPAPTRIISWEQLCIDADPDFQAGLTRPWVYVMSNGRLFYQLNPVYSAPVGGQWTLDDPILSQLDQGNVLG